MNILLLGENPRGDFLVQKLTSSRNHLFGIPGKPGWKGRVECQSIDYNYSRKILGWIREKKIDLTLAMEPSAGEKGLLDYLVKKYQKVFGPLKKLVEWKKNPQNFYGTLIKYGLPLKDFRLFEDQDKARAHISSLDHYPLYFKDMNQKQTWLIQTEEEAQEKIAAVLEQPKAVDAPRNILSIEEILSGEEIYFYCLLDGDNTLPLGPVRVHKSDDLHNPFPYAMAAYTPWQGLSSHQYQALERDILLPLNHLFTAEKMKFRGLIEIQMKFTPGGPKVLDMDILWEPIAFLPLLNRFGKDLSSVLRAASSRNLHKLPELQWEKEASLALGISLEESAMTLEELSFPGKDLQVIPLGPSLVALLSSGKTLEEAAKRAEDFSKDLHLPLNPYQKELMEKLRNPEKEKKPTKKPVKEAEKKTGKESGKKSEKKSEKSSGKGKRKGKEKESKE